MDVDGIEQAVADTLEDTGYRGDTYGEYHPSSVTGCPLKVTLDKMVEQEDGLNCWMFQGSAVHYYLQEHTSPQGYDGIITEALHNAGYHTLDSEYEVHTKKEIGDGVTLTGTCDVLCSDGDKSTIFDLKYSSVTPSTHKGRLMSYLSQVNTYSHMFDADEHGLILINSRAGMGNSPPHTIPEGVTVVGGTPEEDNWELTKSKAKAIHNVLEAAGFQDDNRWTTDMLESADLDFWEELLETIDKDHCPSYEKECKYCDHKEYCPVKQGKLSSGLDSFRGGT